MHKVSLIIPVYNAAGCIVRCLDSIAAQTMDERDIQVIVVDDCSTDDSTALAADWFSAHNQLSYKLIRQELNAGPGTARNEGLTEADGQYIAFVDADDTLEPRYCEMLYNAAAARLDDMAYCFAYAGGRLLTNPVDTCNRSKLLRTTVTYLWTGLFRKEFLQAQGICFPATRCAEDSCFWLSAIMAAASISVVPEALYIYTPTDSSLSARPGSAKAADRRASMRALRRWARQFGFYRLYRPSLEYVIFKKGTLLSLKDRLTR